MRSPDEINELLRLDDDALLDTRDAASVVGLAYNTLNWYRQHSPERGPRFRRLGSAIRYRMGDLRAFVASKEA